ncbi:hypothetical protein [Leptolyngbya ohadii]|uniref:hypothetical protein n=1 Tax=Leptolyngbya ohadii TaxID=1962290 RepID=UPI001CECD26C|nr:hypothetical protein [Leptolyngbya ohadii]
MMTQSYFTDAEWSILMQAPVQALSAVILADKSDPVSFLKEVKAAVQIMLEEQQRQDLSSDLGRSLIQSFRDSLAKESLQGDELVMKKVFEYLGGIANLKSASDGRKQAIAHLDQVSAILAAKVTVMQANEFRQWLVSLARKVAESVKEEGFLGIGGERISRDEASTLKDIEKALQV